jgi:hypothetical protein
MIRPITLGEVACHGSRLQVVCADCSYVWNFPVASFRLPSDTPFPSVAKGMQCGVCGSPNMRARPPLFLVVSR